MMMSFKMAIITDGRNAAVVQGKNRVESGAKYELARTSWRSSLTILLAISCDNAANTFLPKRIIMLFIELTEWIYQL